MQYFSAIPFSGVADFSKKAENNPIFQSSFVYVG
jgi:hypothetical protein